MECWDELLKEYDEIVHIPMSSGLSSTCHAAQSLSQEYEGKVCVVDNQRISVTQKQSVEDAIVLRDAGKSAAEIKEILEAEKLQASIYITVDTLKYLKKRRAAAPAAAADAFSKGTVLNLKPVLQKEEAQEWKPGDKLDAFSNGSDLRIAAGIMKAAF